MFAGNVTIHFFCNQITYNQLQGWGVSTHIYYSTSTVDWCSKTLEAIKLTPSDRKRVPVNNICTAAAAGGLTLQNQYTRTVQSAVNQYRHLNIPMKDWCLPSHNGQPAPSCSGARTQDNNQHVFRVMGSYAHHTKHFTV